MLWCRCPALVLISYMNDLLLNNCFGPSLRSQLIMLWFRCPTLVFIYNMNFNLQCSAVPYDTMFKPIGRDCVIRESCYKETILQKNSRKRTIPWSFSCNSFVKFRGKILVSHNMSIQICVITRCVIKELHCTSISVFPHPTFSFCSPKHKVLKSEVQ